MKRFKIYLLITFLMIPFNIAPAHSQQEQMADNPLILLRQGQDQKKALKVSESIYQAIGFGNTFMVVTPAGNVIIDTSMPFNAARHKQLLTAESAASIKYIILTHTHGDHAGGVPTWKQPGTQIIAQKKHVDFQNYQTRLAGFYARRNAAAIKFHVTIKREVNGNEYNHR